MYISQKTLRTVGTILIVLGIAFGVGLIGYQYLHCADMWNTEPKAGSFGSLPEYFFAVSGGAILFALCGGGILAIPGILRLKKTAVSQ